MKENNVLVINCGSSSLKFSLLDPQTNNVILNGLAQRLLSDQAVITIDHNKKIESSLSKPFDHLSAITYLVTYLEGQKLTQSITSIGHRVVHGGEKYAEPTLINESVLNTIEELSLLAPLHNPANIVGIKATQQAFPQLPQVAIFDTAFHQTMPEKAFLYAIPASLYQEHGIRRYGFHGTSHYFVALQAAKLMNKPLNKCNLISAHLGNGCSITAIKNGESVDTSMGLTPLEGVMMGTRSGDIDPGVIFHMHDTLSLSIKEINAMLNKESGLLGVSKLSNDCRTLEKAALLENDKAALTALQLFCYRIAKTVASYSASLTELDGIIFTGGIGENSSFVRKTVIAQLSLLGFSINDKNNDDVRFGKCGEIQAPSSKKCWVIPTDEEWVIAHQTQQLTVNLINKEIQ